MFLKNEMDAWYVYTMECYPAVKMNELLIHIAVWANLRNSKRNQTQKYILYDSIYMQFQKL